MDEITLLRVIATVASFVTFIVIWAWAWKRSNRARFEEARLIPFQQD
jgi:cytochrome c oxidase cbb3-type subunit IV